MMKKNVIKNFKKERKVRIEKVKKFLSDNDYKNAKENLDWIQASFTIENISRGPRTLFWSTLIIVISIIIIGICIFIRIPTAHISLNITTSTVNFQLSRNYMLTTSSRITELGISNLVELNSPGFIKKTKEPFEMTLKGNGIGLSRITLPSNTQVTINQTNDRLSILLKGIKLNTTIFTNDAHLFIDNKLQRIIKSGTSEPIDIKSLYASLTEGAFTKITIKDTSTWKLNNLTIQDLSFDNYEMDTILKNISTIFSGKISILETGQQKNLEEGDWLIIQGLRNKKTQINEENGKIKIMLEGSVNGLYAGTSKEFERNLMPTLIEYFYYSRSVGLFWGSMVFLWSILWSLKNIVFKSGTI
jgi:hypothetical protein